MYICIQKGGLLLFDFNGKRQHVHACFASMSMRECVCVCVCVCVSLIPQMAGLTSSLSRHSLAGCSRASLSTCGISFHIDCRNCVGEVECTSPSIERLLTWAGLERLRVCLRLLRGSQSAGVGWGERSSYRHRRSICLCSVSIWSDICRSDGARATTDRIASRRKVGVSWKCLGWESACCTQRPRQPAGKKGGR